MRWLIVEDALRDRKGHWFEYLRTFKEGLRALGDEVTILADQQAEPFILEKLEAKPVLPNSIWHRMGDGAGALKRYGRVPLHAWQTWRTLRRFLRKDDQWDIIFVPTVLVHHLLGWYWLRSSFRTGCTRLLLFFPNLPIKLASNGNPAWIPSPTTRLMSRLLRGLKPDLLSGRIILGVETHEMREALARLSGLPVTYFPHPVQPLTDAAADNKPPGSDGLLMACYGPARGEKGSDVLQEAVAHHLRKFPNSTTRFAYQWVQDFRNDAGKLVEVNPALLSHARVNVIRHYFKEDDYARHLLATHVLLLPYRRSSYGLRVSRVIIEAMVNGIPVVATNGTTLHSQAAEFGAAEGCEDGSAESLGAAIQAIERDYPALHARALERMPQARRHFSVQYFRALLLTNCAQVEVN